MRFTGYSFGSIRVDGVTYDHDLIIDRGKIRKRKKAASRKFRGKYRHTPLPVAEDIPWRCRRLVAGSGAGGALPVMQQVRDEARLGSYGTSAPVDPFWVGSGGRALLVAAIECDVASLLSLAGQAGSIR